MSIIYKILIIIAITTISVTIVQKIFNKILKAKSSTSVAFLKNCIIVALLAICVFTCMSQIEGTKEISKTLLQGSSIIIAIITFAAQKVVGNVISGFALTTVKPFDINEKITLISTGGTTVVEGVVIDINTRHTTIRQMDGKCAMVPNGVLDEMIVLNNHVLDIHGFPLPMWCTYDSDVELAIELMKDEIDKNPLTVKNDGQETVVLCAELGDNGFRLQSIIWTKELSDNFKACSQLRIAIFKRWKENGIEVPFNTITVLNG